MNWLYNPRIYWFWYWYYRFDAGDDVIISDGVDAYFGVDDVDVVDIV